MPYAMSDTLAAASTDVAAAGGKSVMFDSIAPDPSDASSVEILGGAQSSFTSVGGAASLITQAVRFTAKRKAEDVQICQPVIRQRTGEEICSLDTRNPSLSHNPSAPVASTGSSLVGNTETLPTAMVEARERTPADSSTTSTDTTLDDRDDLTDLFDDREASDRTPLGCLFGDDDSVCPDLTGFEPDPELEYSEEEEQACHEDACNDEDEEEEYAEFDPYAFIKQLPPLETIPVSNTPGLPPKAAGCDKMTLILDLDETLVHSSLDGGSDPDFSFDVSFNGQSHVVNVSQRPFLHEFLKAVSGRFEVVIFTASQQVYAEQLLDILDPEGTLIDHRLYRDSCVFVDGNYLKDISGLGRELSRTVIVDNSPHAFGFQVPNGIPIESWYDDTEDEELKRLLPFLDQLDSQSDVRPLVSSTFKLHELIDMADGTL